MNSPQHHDSAGRLLVNERTAAQMLSVSARTLWTLRQQGKIPYVKLGGRVLYSPATLAEWIAATQSDSLPRDPKAKRESTL
jgi:excisionase family DNA binding protein